MTAVARAGRLAGAARSRQEAGNDATLPAADSVSPAQAVRAMLEARSVALVGASARPGSFGWRMLAEARKSPAGPAIYPVNPRYAQIDGLRCYPSLAELPACDLVLLAVPDAALEDQLALAAARGSRAAVIFGNAHEPVPPPGLPLRDRLAAIAGSHGMALCGAGCMGFVNVSYGLRAIGYTEADPVTAGPVALVTHSGSVFSALLRARRGLGFTLAVSSGQELVTAAPAYLDYALDLPETRVLALVLEAIRDGLALRGALRRAAERDVPVVLLTVGGSAGGREMVAAHSGALAGSDGGWEALARAYGVHRVSDLAELADTVELFAIGRRAAPRPPGCSGLRGIATVHDSGLERAHLVDMAESLGVPFAEIGPATTNRLAGLLDPGLLPVNPLDVWGTGADERALFGGSLLALADDPAVDAVALAVDFVPELDGDESYRLAMLDVAEHTNKPVAVLANLPSAIDLGWAGQLRAQGIPVLEGTRSGLLALRHLLDHATGMPGTGLPAAGGPLADAHPGRRARGAALLGDGEPAGAAVLSLLAEYGIQVADAVSAGDLDSVVAAADSIGYPVVLKTAEPGILHKSDVGGVLLGISDAQALAAGYADLAGRLGPRVQVCRAVPAGIELALGVTADPELGPLIVVGAGGTLVELLADRAVALPPVAAEVAAGLVAGLRIGALLAGVRGAQPADMRAVTMAIAALSELAVELGDQIEALDVNPLICGPDGAIAVDALAIPRRQRP
jgi:acetate---CoA ligase (ADP-forming)